MHTMAHTDAHVSARARAHTHTHTHSHSLTHMNVYDNFLLKGWFNLVLLYMFVIIAIWELGYRLSLRPTWSAKRQNKM